MLAAVGKGKGRRKRAGGKRLKRPLAMDICLVMHFSRKTLDGLKYLSYFKLGEALRLSGCPICTLVEKDSFRYLDALLYERVNDVGTRGKLRKSLGFCSWHAWKSTEISNCTLGLAIIYEDILGAIGEKLRKMASNFPPSAANSFWSKFFSKKEKKITGNFPEALASCPVCQHVRIFEEHYLAILLDYFQERDFAQVFAESGGICFNHLQEVIKNFPDHKNLPLLITRQMEIYKVLRKELAEFIRKQDYQHRHEPAGREIDSWKRAIEMVIGKKEVFPNQIRTGRYKNKK